MCLCYSLTDVSGCARGMAARSFCFHGLCLRSNFVRRPYKGNDCLARFSRADNMNVMSAMASISHLFSCLKPSLRENNCPLINDKDGFSRQ